MDLAPSLFALGDLNTLPQQLVNGVLLGAIYALIALGYTMVYGVLRLINFAHGEVFMLGAYVALFVSWSVGFATGGDGKGVSPGLVANVSFMLLGLAVLVAILWAVLKSSGRFPRSGIYYALVLGFVGGLGAAVAFLQPQASSLLVMLMASMIVCGLVGVIIELFAYRPMRSQPRIAALITAIGVSLLLQYGGALFLPNSPPPSINERVNPYRGTAVIPLSPADPKLQQRYETAKAAFETGEQAWQTALESEPDRTKPSESTEALRREKNRLENELNQAQRPYDNSGVKIRIPYGQLIMFITTLVLMLMLRQLVLFTPAGRAMRAVSHDFDSAALMGINVNRVVTFTFLIGSMLAGAGAMMNATFIGTPLTTFYGLQPGVKAFVAAVLGGIGNIPGAVLGGLLMGVAETMVVWLNYSEYRDAIAFVILIVVLLFRPGGLMGSAKVEKV